MKCQLGKFPDSPDLRIGASLVSAAEIQALVSAWQNGAISRDTLLHNLRTGEVLPPARTNEEEVELIGREPSPVVMKAASAVRAGETGVVLREVQSG